VHTHLRTAQPTGQGRVRIDGQNHCLGPHGSDESERKYEELVRKRISGRAAEELEARVQVASDLTISELILSVLRHAKADSVKDGRQSSEFGVNVPTLRMLRERHDHESVTTFGHLKLLTLRDQWAADWIVRTQVDHRMKSVRRMFSWGVSRQLVPPGILEAVKTVEGLRKGRCNARKGRKLQPVPNARVDAVRPFVSRQVWAMIELQSPTGTRPVEATIMRTIDIDTTREIWTYMPGSEIQ
jgi:hypothetical protein